MSPPDGQPQRFVQSGEDRDRVKDASDIVRVVGEHLELRPRGREYVGLCPFHDDHTPSMSVVPSKQIFHCFACGAGGDVFSFVMQYHRMEFPEALRYLADRAGIELSRDRVSSGGGPSKRATLTEANAFALAFFRTILRHEQHGSSARDVIERRRIADEMVEAFELGAAPDRWDGLLKTIEAKRLETGAFAEVGLLKTRETGGHYDALRHRLVFPIHDQAGRVIAFGGRKINEEDDPKYLNSPESAVFDKSSTLYGLHQAGRAIQKQGLAIVTEGYTDVIACHQAGFTNAVATLGTALTPGHARVLRRLCETVVLLFDGDEAGRRAADRAVEVFFSEPIDVKIATLAPATDAKDPDELLKREDGAGVFERIIDEAADILDYRLEATRQRLSVSGVSAFERAYEDEIRTLAGLGLNRAKPLRRQLIVRRLVELTGMDVRTVTSALGEAGARASGRAPAEIEAKRPASLEPADWVVGALLCDATLLLALPEDDRLRRACSPETGGVLDALLAGVSPDASDPLLDVLGEIGDESLRAHAVRLERHVQSLTDGENERVREHARASLDRLGGTGQRPQSTSERLAALREGGAGSGNRRLPRPPGGNDRKQGPGGMDAPPSAGQ